MEDGKLLEYRMLRLFLARGIFAERSLVPAVGNDYEKSATDIDVLAVEYGTGFKSTRVNVECKSGKNVSKLDRVLWLAGVQQLIEADTSYFLVPESEEDVARFAKDLNVATFTQMHLKMWEGSLGLHPDHWIARSHLNVYEPLNGKWKAALKEAKGNDPDLLLIKDAERFLKTDGWLSFSYSNLNRLLRLTQDLGALLLRLEPTLEKSLFARFFLGALYVRFSQYLLEVCSDVLTLPPSQLDDYLRERLTFGDVSSSSSTTLISQTLTWVSHVLDARSIPMPQELNIERLNVPPSYTGEFLSLVHKLLERSAEAAQLVIAAELLMFSLGGEDWNDHLQSVYQKGEHLALNSRAFLVRVAGIQSEMLDSFGDIVARHFDIQWTPPHVTALGSMTKGTTVSPKHDVANLDQLQIPGTGETLLGQMPGIGMDIASVSELKSLQDVEPQLPRTEKEKLGRLWVEEKLRDTAAQRGHQIAGEIQWNQSRKKVEVKLKLDGASKILELPHTQLAELGIEGRAREKFSKRLEQEVFAKAGSKRR